MADENKSYFMIIAIVAIVAIVALVIMVSGNKGNVGNLALNKGNDLVGNAVFGAGGVPPKTTACFCIGGNGDCMFDVGCKPDTRSGKTPCDGTCTEEYR